MSPYSVFATWSLFVPGEGTQTGFMMQVVVVDNYFTGTKSNLKQWLGHPDFELIRHGKAITCGMELDFVFKYLSYANCEGTSACC
jgi:hypothetical protein